MENSCPLISVIVPVYKAEKYLDRCVASIVSQSYINLEIILVDDGSPDKSGEMCDVWANRDSRIKVIHKKNSGASQARNAALDIANGEWIGFVDSDDYINPQMYEWLIAETMRNNVGIIGGDYLFMEEPSKTFYNRETFSETREIPSEDVFESLLYARTSIQIWNKIYRRSLLENIRFIQGRHAHDRQFNLDVALRMKKEKFSMFEIPKILVYYTKNDEGITWGSRLRQQMHIYLNNLEAAIKYAKDYPEDSRSQLFLRDQWRDVFVLDSSFYSKTTPFYRQPKLRAEFIKIISDISWSDFFLFNHSIKNIMKFSFIKYFPYCLEILRQ